MHVFLIQGDARAEGGRAEEFSQPVGG
jgi:hypothetical protein